jgi:hypothetical protein
MMVLANDEQIAVMRAEGTFHESGPFYICLGEIGDFIEANVETNVKQTEEQSK